MNETVFIEQLVGYVRNRDLLEHVNISDYRDIIYDIDPKRKSDDQRTSSRIGPVALAVKHVLCRRTWS